MLDNLRFDPQAQSDMICIRDWIARHSLEKSVKFLDELFVVLKRISDSPLIHPIGVEDIRFSRLNKFQYLVIFRMVKNTPHVFGVVHNSTDTATWLERLANIE